MGTLYNVLVVIGVIALVKGVIILLFPEGIMGIAKHFTKNKQRIRNAALIEVILAIVLFLMAILIN